MKYCFRCMNDMADSEEVCPHCGMEQRTYAAPPHILQAGTVVNGRYLIGGLIGEGGFGITYIGLDSLLKYRVAVKEFFPNGMATRNSTVSAEVQTIGSEKSRDFFCKARDNFLREAQVLARFNEEPSVVSVKDFFDANNTVYIVMEYLEGITLKQHLNRKGGRIPWREAVSLLMPVLSALKKIHSEGLIHRDISPDNIMLVKGSVKLLDFGAAREYTDEKSLSVMLKHGYAPFEQYKRHGDQGAWTDIYAFCATLYKCITGETPVQATDRIEEDTLKMPSELGIEVGEVFEDVLRRGLAVRVRERIHTDDELIAGLQAALSDKRIAVISDSEMTVIDEEYHAPKKRAEAIFPSPVPRSEPVKRMQPQHSKQNTPPVAVRHESDIPVVKKKRGSMIAAVCAGLCVVGVGIGFIAGKGSKKDNENIPVIATTTAAEEVATAAATTSTAKKTKTTAALTTTSAATTTVKPKETEKDEIIDSGVCGKNVSWELDKNGTLTISGSGKMES
nr:serine/threonine protein kinase [Ruminococcus sp.]